MGCASSQPVTRSFENARQPLSTVELEKYAEDFEIACCRKSSGAFLSEQQYRTALFNYVYHSLDIDKNGPEPSFRSHVFVKCSNYVPAGVSLGGWRYSAAGLNDIWIGLQIINFPNPTWFKQRQNQDLTGNLIDI